MPGIISSDAKTGRKFYLDDPDDLGPGRAEVFVYPDATGGRMIATSCVSTRDIPKASSPT